MLIPLFILTIILAMVIAPMFMVIELYRKEADGSFPWTVGLTIIVWFIGALALIKIQDYV